MNITEERKSILLLHIPDINQSINNGDLDDVLDQLDDKITEIGFNRDYTLNEIGLKLQKLYDELYVQNC